MRLGRACSGGRGLLPLEGGGPTRPKRSRGGGHFVQRAWMGEIPAPICAPQIGPPLFKGRSSPRCAVSEPALVVRRTHALRAAHHEGFLMLAACGGRRCFLVLGAACSIRQVSRRRLSVAFASVAA